MKQIRVTLTDDQYAWAKSKGRLWLRKVISDLKWLEEHPDAKPWWRFWRG